MPHIYVSVGLINPAAEYTICWLALKKNLDGGRMESVTRTVVLQNSPSLVFSDHEESVNHKSSALHLHSRLTKQCLKYGRMGAVATNCCSSAVTPLEFSLFSHFWWRECWSETLHMDEDWKKKCLDGRKQSLIENQSAGRRFRSDWQQKPPHTTSTYYSLALAPLSSRHICCNLHHGINLQQHRSMTILKVWCSWSFTFKRELIVQ